MRPTELSICHMRAFLERLLRGILHYQRDFELVCNAANVAGRLLSDLFKLITEGHIKPTSPVRRFNFSEIPAAFRYMRQGNHIGKIIFSKRAYETVKVPVCQDCAA